MVSELSGQRGWIDPLDSFSRGIRVPSFCKTGNTTIVVPASLVEGRRPGVSPVVDFHGCKWILEVGAVLIWLSFRLLFLPDRAGLGNVAKKLRHGRSDTRRG